MRVALTGASGHIGYHVASRLLQGGHEVRLLLRAPNVLTRRLERSGAGTRLVDLLAPETLPAALAGVEVLFIWRRRTRPRRPPPLWWSFPPRG